MDAMKHTVRRAWIQLIIKIRRKKEWLLQAMIPEMINNGYYIGQGGLMFLEPSRPLGVMDNTRPLAVIDNTGY